MYLPLLSIITLFLLFNPHPSHSTTPSTTIQRTTDLDTLAAIPPSTEPTSLPLLTSPSGTTIAYLIRSSSSSTTDSCYVQVQEATGQSLWESECASVSSFDECTATFSPTGLAVFDGTLSVWSSGADNGRSAAAIELADDGDLRVTDEEGVVMWQSSDDPRVNQGCGVAVPPPAEYNNIPPPPLISRGLPVGTKGPATVVAPVAAPTSNGGSSHPFGQVMPTPDSEELQPPQPNGEVTGQQPQQGLKGLNQPAVVGGAQPLVDNTPYNSGGSRVVEVWCVLSFLCGFVL